MLFIIIEVIIIMKLLLNKLKALT